MENNLSIVILAAGKGSRMKSDTPKVLHEIANKSMLLHVIDNSKKLKPKNIYVVLGKKSDDIKNILPKNIKVITQDEQLGTAHALLCAKYIRYQVGKRRYYFTCISCMAIKSNSVAYWFIFSLSF